MDTVDRVAFVAEPTLSDYVESNDEARRVALSIITSR